VEEACPGIQGLSLVDDVAWWAEGKSEKEVAEALGRAAGVALDWGVFFDGGHVSVQAKEETHL